MIENLKLIDVINKYIYNVEEEILELNDYNQVFNFILNKHKILIFINRILISIHVIF
jgi:septation ring formation regulator EzrA